MAAGGGGAWKVAYADFVTAMMAFFMVMWITAQNEKMKQSVQHYFNDPFNSESKTKGPEAAGSTTTGPLAPGSKQLLPNTRPGDPPGIKREKKAPKSVGRKVDATGPKAWSGEGNKMAGVGKPTLIVRNDGKDPHNGAVLVFADRGSELTDKAKDQLKKLVPLLAGKRQKIEIRGHARQLSAPENGSAGGDSSGGDIEAWQLSYARCMATMKYLVQAGIEADRFRLSQAGPNEPRTITEGAEHLTQNSCVDVKVLPELVDDYFGSRDERAALDQSP
jgi:chemotaxis protein MotB